MIRKIFTLLAFSILTFNVDAQEIDKNQWTIVTKRTADWCGFCGGWGWSFMKNIYEDLKNEKVMVWAAHHSGNLSNSISAAVANNFGAVGQPTFFVNEENMGVTSGNSATKRTELVNFVRELNMLPPFAGLGVDAFYKNGKVEVNTSIEFFENFPNAEMYVANYIVRDNLIAPQSGQGANAKHINVLSDEVNNSPFGTPLNATSFNKGDKFSLNAEFDNFSLHSDKIEDVKIASVLWSKVNNKYVFINAVVKNLMQSSNTYDFSDKQQLKWKRMPNGIELTGVGNIPVSRINMYDIQGREVSVSIIPNGTDSFLINTNSIPQGHYVISVYSDSLIQSVRVIVD